ncbi:mini-chromosome maintenance complex-binding protein [Asbolus verrucosus]|uniref:Mini-chromosome maintenance complex-binding protein n=1 Tax=Asbolus verrucosus TaxID=1661398 RepID=A0A482W5S0_ASBVE|nr:mini-chromosome maintenance complex-binding protein [Asbolus verrucosus]
MDIQNCTPEQWYKNENNWLEVLENESIWNQIPLLNVNELHNLKDSRLVRFRGMIQDMHGPEFYLEKFEVRNEDTQGITVKFGKYVDICDYRPNETVIMEGENIRSERQTYVAISIPAINSWVKKIEEERFKILSTPTPSTSSECIQLKRSLEEMEVDHTEPQPAEQSNVANKKQRTELSKPETESVVSQEHLLNFPIPDPSGRVCHLKVYRNAELLKLNSVCEFVGFLSVNPSLVCQNMDEGADEVEFQVHNPPPSLIPKLHCVHFKHLPHNNPLVNERGMVPERMQYIKKELLILLTQLLFGDELTAEYMIYHLISEVYLRKDFMAIGKFSLNVSNIPKIENLDYVQELYKFLTLLLTKSHYIAMSLENMNELTFIPKKDYTSNRLTSSVLQLSSNTHLVLDETKLSTGKLNETGINGVKALANAIKNQKTMYDFTYYQLEFDCDIPFLILSEGKSMLPSDVHIVLEPDEMHLNTFNEILEAARHFLKPDLLNEMRLYITQAKLTQYEITDGIQELVQNEFVNMRQKGNVSGDDLHNLLVLARLVCISQGKNTLNPECWKQACSLEEARKERIKKTVKQ